MSGSTPHLPACSCCGKPGNKVDKLIQIAEDFYICNNCVEICVNMIVKDTGLPMATRFIRGILNMEPSAYAMCQAEARKAAAADMLRETEAGPASVVLSVENSGVWRKGSGQAAPAVLKYLRRVSTPRPSGKRPSRREQARRDTFVRRSAAVL